MLNVSKFRISVKRTSNIPIDVIKREIETRGFCVVSSQSISASELVNLAHQFGRIQCHERSGRNGLVDVTSDPNLQGQTASQFRGLGTGDFQPHTDGAFLNTIYLDKEAKMRHVSQPSMLMLQCVQQAKKGGASALVDGQKVFEKIKSEHPDAFQRLCETVYTFVREDKSFFPFEAPVFSTLSNANICIRFREDYILQETFCSHVEACEDAMHYLMDECLTHDDCRLEFMLDVGDILIVDNFRMLHGRSNFAVVKGHHRHLRRAWVLDEYHLQRLDANNDFVVEVEGNRVDVLMERMLRHNHFVAKSYRPHLKSQRSRSFVELELGITC